MTKFILKKVGLVALTLAATPISAGQADTLIGRWCDQLIPKNPRLTSVITIYLDQTGAPKVQFEFSDGSRMTKALVKSGNAFTVVESRYGEKYRVDPNNGALHLIDNEGLIRIARRLNNTPSQDECR